MYFYRKMLEYPGLNMWITRSFRVNENKFQVILGVGGGQNLLS